MIIIFFIGISGSSNIVYAIGTSFGINSDVISTILQFSREYLKLFDTSSSDIKSQFVSYGDASHKLQSPEIQREILISKIPYIGNVGNTLIDMLENIKKNVTSGSHNQPTQLVIFINERIVRDKKNIKPIKESIKFLKQNGFKILVIGTTYKVFNKDLKDLLDGDNLIILSNVKEFPEKIDEVEEKSTRLTTGIYVF